MHESRNEFLEHLYSEYYDSVFRLCIVIAGYDKQHYPLIEDCIQDAFIEALDKYDDYKYYKNPIGWIAKVAGNRLRMRCAKKRTDVRLYLHTCGYEVKMRPFLVALSSEKWIAKRWLRTSSVFIVC